jgi:hypothetical protein
VAEPEDLDIHLRPSREERPQVIRITDSLESIDQLPELVERVNPILRQIVELRRMGADPVAEHTKFGLDFSKS